MATAAVSLAPFARRGVAAGSRSKRGPSEGRQPALDTVGLRSDTPGFDRERVSEIQRSRLLAAAGQVCCEHGAANVTVGQIVERAGVSRRTFYELYRDGEECLLATFDDALARARERVLDAWSVERAGWRERTRSCLVALLGLFDEDPVLARLLVVESLAAGHRGLADRARVLDGLVDTLANSLPMELTAARGRVRSDTSKNAAAAGRLSVEGALGAVLGMLHTRISQRSPGHLIELTGPLMGMFVLPHDGPAAARREAQRPVPATPTSPQGGPRVVFRSDPFKAAGMRLTYRTMRVLCAIEEQPGSSNRKIAGLADIGDQGQVSKLLARLERIGMIANTATGATRGEANAWTLTPTGRQVTSRLNAQTQQPGARTR